VPNVFQSERSQVACAAAIRKCGGYTGNLPIARQGNKWLSAKDIETMNLPGEILLVNQFQLDFELKRLENLILNDNVFVSDGSGGAIIFQGGHMRVGYEDVGAKYTANFDAYSNLTGAFLEALALAWKIDPKRLSEFNPIERTYDLPIGSNDGVEVRAAAILVRRDVFG
jgi:hypothetical protein